MKIEQVPGKPPRFPPPAAFFFFFNTVKTRRDRLKQPKFVLRCVQLMVGLPCPID